MNNVLQNMDNTNIYFNSLKRADWLRQIATIRNEYKKENYQKALDVLKALGYMIID